MLGEQSARSLRGDRMEDVIFGGSDARKPTAAAEVRLKLSGVAARVPGIQSGRGTAEPGSGNGSTGGNGHHALGDADAAMLAELDGRRRGGGAGGDRRDA